MRRFLLLGGGTAKGAKQVYPIWQLLHMHGLDSYVGVAGVSVGSLNGVMFAMGKLEDLYGLWNKVKGVSFFMKPRVPATAVVWGLLVALLGLVFLPAAYAAPVVFALLCANRMRGGLFSLAPLRKHMQAHVKVKDLRIPFWAGVTDLLTEQYYSVRATTDRDLHNALMASCAQPVIMQAERCKHGDRDLLGVDGGVMAVVPRLPVPLDDVDAIDVVMCSPIDRLGFKPLNKVDSLLEAGLRTLEMYGDATVREDVRRLYEYAAAGKIVTVYAPTRSDSSFDASSEAVEYRLYVEGPSMWAQPLRITG